MFGPYVFWEVPWGSVLCVFFYFVEYFKTMLMVLLHFVEHLEELIFWVNFKYLKEMSPSYSSKCVNLFYSY